MRYEAPTQAMNVVGNTLTNITDMNTTELPKFPNIPLTEFIGVSVAVFSSIGVVANILVLAVLYISQRRRFTSYGYLISHLAFSDLVASIFLLTYVPVELSNHDWIYSDHVCKVIYPSITIVNNLAVGTILIISAERYRGVMFPLKSHWNVNNIRIALSIVWLVGIGTVIPSLVVTKVTPYQNLNYCNEFWVDNDIRRVYGISFFIGAFLLPVVAVLFMHVSIIIRLTNRDLRPANTSDYQTKTNNRIMRVLTAVIIALFVCVAPNKLLYFMWDMYPSLEKSLESNVRFYLRSFQILYHARVALDPLLYCFLDTRFKTDCENSVRAMRGMSIIDSEFVSRARSISQRAASMVLRSRASSTVNMEQQPPQKEQVSSIALITRLASLQEENKTNPCTFIEGETESKLRSNTMADSGCGSSSPFFKGHISILSESQNGVICNTEIQ